MPSLDVWYLFNRDFYVGLFIHNDETDEFSCIVESEGYLVDETIFRLKLDQGSDGIKFAIYDRCFPENRVNCRELLRYLDLTEYNKWNILKKINMCNVNDGIWISKEKDESLYFKINPRGAAGM